MLSDSLCKLSSHSPNLFVPRIPEFILPAFPRKSSKVAFSDNPRFPVAFFPVNLNKVVIHVFTDLNIAFPNKYTVCPESSLCKLDHYNMYDPLNKVFFITTGGVVRNPTPGTLGNWSFS
ncbi:unnamed protein product [Fraxinus pennsylvanica]|uniref:Uncharacterized protein n=1 Tax=Fraxinus pennsylvanica TaxID=56036 RepID=A0AAD2DPL9_9LAMI|nr:unnamed protein product [Fraxinus pennsylvanica]